MCSSVARQLLDLCCAGGSGLSDDARRPRFQTCCCCRRSLQQGTRAFSIGLSLLVTTYAILRVIRVTAMPCGGASLVLASPGIFPVVQLVLSVIDILFASTCALGFLSSYRRFPRAARRLNRRFVRCIQVYMCIVLLDMIYTASAVSTDQTFHETQDGHMDLEIDSDVPDEPAVDGSTVCAGPGDGSIAIGVAYSLVLELLLLYAVFIVGDDEEAMETQAAEFFPVDATLPLNAAQHVALSPIMSSRLDKEAARLTACSLPGLSLSTTETTSTPNDLPRPLWRVRLRGPQGSSFEDRDAEVEVSFPVNYPFEPPEIRIRGEMRDEHPLVGPQGEVLPVEEWIQSSWTVHVTVAEMLQRAWDELQLSAVRQGAAR